MLYYQTFTVYIKLLFLDGSCSAYYKHVLIDKVVVGPRTDVLPWIALLQAQPGEYVCSLGSLIIRRYVSATNAQLTAQAN